MKKRDILRLFHRLGYIYGGTGNSFVLPNVSGRMALGTSDSHQLGEKGGAEDVTLIVAQLPVHGHDVNVNPHSHTITSYVDAPDTGLSGNYPVGLNYKTYPWWFDYPPYSRNKYAQIGSVIPTSTDENTGTAQNTGGSQAHNNMPPYLSLNMIIKA